MKRLALLACLAITPAASAQQTPDQEAPQASLPVRLAPKVTLSDLIFLQLREKACWQESANPSFDVPRVSYRVRIGEDGRLSEPPELVKPKSLPVADESIKALADKALKALETCNAKGFALPSSRTDRNQPVILTFPDWYAYKQP